MTSIHPSHSKFGAAGLALVAAALVAGCSTTSLTGSKSEGTTSAASGSVPFGDRVSSLFGGITRPQASAQTQASAADTTPTSEDFDCPAIDVRQGASTLQENTPGVEPSALTLRYQVTFVRAARECRVQGSNVNIKIGVQGRVILGPAGGPGPTDIKVPLRYALVQETLNESKSIWTKLYTVPVTLPAQTQSVEFTHISDDLTIPIPKPADLAQMIVYIGFDPLGAEQEKRKPGPRKPRRH